MATRTAGGRRGRTIYMSDESWAQLSRLPLPTLRRDSDSSRLEALVREYPRLVEQLAREREECRRLREQLQRVHDLGMQVEVAQRQVESALHTVIERLHPVQEMVWSALRDLPQGRSEARGGH